jgi:hypothetical protein
VTKLLLSLHVLAAVLAIGPVAVAASMFPAVTRRGDRQSLPLLHRICRVYAVLGVAVPVFGLATASSLGVLTDAWLIVSIVLTAVAAALLAFAILPAQHRIVAASTGPGSGNADGGGSGNADGDGSANAGGDGSGNADGNGNPARLGMLTGVFNLLWAAVVVLMIVRPGSTTGA